MAYKLLACILFLALSSAGKEKTRWSRQLSTYTADISDWVPLPGPAETEPLQIRRQAIAEPRILSEPFSGFTRPTGFTQDDFPPRPLFNAQSNRQLYLQAVPSAPQNYLTDQGFGQGLKFGLTQPNSPFSQGFVSPQLNFDSIPQIKSRPPTLSNAGKFDSFPKQTQPFPPQIKPQFINQALKLKPEAPKFVDGYRVVNTSDFGMPKKAPTLQKIKFDNFEKPKETNSQTKSKTEREEVQLLYVPIESLNRGQFNFRSPLTSAQILNTDLYNQNLRINPLKQNLAAEYQRPLPKPLDTFNSQEALNDFNRQLIGFEQSPNFSSLTSPFPTAPPTTPKPKKLKPHQPPLAIFLTPESKDKNVKVGDVLNSLKNADSVPVLDSVNPLNAPKVFIGPSNLSPPDNFVKFELPYLSNIENVDKKLRQLPFFVAPLSYNTPQGFAKIPFPSPHVGSVIINSQIRESHTQPLLANTPLPQSVPESYENLYVRPPVYNRPQYQQNIVTQKPQINYYSTVAPKQNNPPNYHNSYYSIEQQTVSTLSPPKQASSTVKSPPKPGSYFLSNFGDQYNPSQYVNFPEEVNHNHPQQVKTYSVAQQETTTTPRTTVTTTTKPSSTHPSQLLETHNPFSINHAFHFNTPVDYQNFFEEYKETHATPGTLSSTTQAATVAPTEAITAPSTVTTQSPKQRYSQTYVQNYSPEIHYQSEIQSSRRPTYQTKDHTNIKNEPTPRTEYKQPETEDLPSQNELEINKINSNTAYKESVDTQPSVDNSYTETVSYMPEPTPDEKQAGDTSYQQYNQQDINYSFEEVQPTESSSTTTTSTTTRRAPLRTRGRPRYTTTRTDANEYTTRATVTRRPYRDRKQPTNRPKYEPNKITTEKTVRESSEIIESTTKPSRTRTRGRIHYKSTGNDEISEKRTKQKEHDLAYQRDVLHQNYPVTLMERTSTVDIDAITESTAKLHVTNTVDESKTFDTENAYTNDKPSITEHVNVELAGDVYASKDLSSESENQYAHHGNTGRNEEYFYQGRSSVAPSAYDEIKEQPSGEERQENEEEIYATSPISSVTEQNIPNYSANNESPTEKQEITTSTEVRINKIASHEVSDDQNQEEQTVETTPSYNRIRVRPGLVRQYHQASSTEATRNTERKKLSQPITYRPAFDKRRTTMRIEEIEADLKTKPVNSRSQYDNHRHPVYKPEPSTESPIPVSTTEMENKRGQFRRRRPVYPTTTEATARKTYDVKNRFRGRRPTEKPTEKPEVQTDISTTTTTKTPLYNRFNHRTKLSERYNKKPEQEEVVTEDQEPNYSINRPKYTSPDSDRWSPKISKDSFKPYNPNDLTDEGKPSETKTKDEELDIITARNEYEDILISVTPATNTNNRVNKKIADIPPTLEAYVEQSKVAKTESSEAVSTFESMLEEVMKSLEEQDEDEYTNKVMKHKGGEIGEIPPEKIITSGENYSSKSTTPVQEETTTKQPATDEQITESHKDDEEDVNRKSRRRGFWKKVKVRPITESFEVAESQYYPNTVNTLGQSVSKISSDKSNENSKKKIKVTTYKPRFQFIKDFFETDDSAFDLTADMDIHKINATRQYDDQTEKIEVTTEPVMKETIADKLNPGDMDWGTGSPDPTLEDAELYSKPTQPTIDRSDGFSFMEYLFGVQSSEETLPVKNETREDSTKAAENAFELDTTKGTTDSYIPEEITADTVTENMAITEDLKNTDNNDATENFMNVETSSVSSFMDPSNVISTSMSTEISHETEICFRGKCIKTNKDLL